MRALTDVYSLLALMVFVLSSFSSLFAKRISKISEKGRLLYITNVAVLVISLVAIGVNFIRVERTNAAGKNPVRTDNFTVRATFTAEVEEKTTINVPFRVEAAVSAPCGGSASREVFQPIPQNAAVKDLSAHWEGVHGNAGSIQTENRGNAVVARGFVEGPPRTPFGFCQGGDGFGVLILQGSYAQEQLTGSHRDVIATNEYSVPANSTLRIALPVTLPKPDISTMQCQLRATKPNQGSSPPAEIDLVLRRADSGEFAVGDTSVHQTELFAVLGVEDRKLVVRIF